jgi:hypothetical protein
MKRLLSYKLIQMTLKYPRHVFDHNKDYTILALVGFDYSNSQVVSYKICPLIPWSLQ